MGVLTALLVAFLVGALVAFVGSFFDRTADNRYAFIAGGLVALLVFLANTSYVNL